MRVEEQEQLDKQKAEQIVTLISRLPEIAKIDIGLYTDYTGDPSFQLIFQVRPNVTIDEAFIDRFKAFAAIVQIAILHSDLNRFPYTRLEQAA